MGEGRGWDVNLVLFSQSKLSTLHAMFGKFNANQKLGWKILTWSIWGDPRIGPFWDPPERVQEQKELVNQSYN